MTRMSISMPISLRSVASAHAFQDYPEEYYLCMELVYLGPCPLVASGVGKVETALSQSAGQAFDFCRCCLSSD